MLTENLLTRPWMGRLIEKAFPIAAVALVGVASPVAAFEPAREAVRPVEICETVADPGRGVPICIGQKAEVEELFHDTVRYPPHPGPHCPGCRPGPTPRPPIPRVETVPGLQLALSSPIVPHLIGQYNGGHLAHELTVAQIIPHSGNLVRPPPTQHPPSKGGITGGKPPGGKGKGGSTGKKK